MGPWRYAINMALSEAEKKEVTGLANAGVTGKWMLFPDVEWVRGVWADVVAATEEGRLGYAAKVATDHKPGKGVLICVYTKDWRDQRDVARVLAELRAMGTGQRLSYKEDAATLALHYGKGASLYVSQAESMDFDQRRSGYTPGDQHALFGDPEEQEERTPEEVFSRDEPYGPFPD
ncbi:uncharacterized protein DUF1917 [Murinocardiopsis flavida]|uniref:Uncharacterized protein DUF1917 n=1 Tax=Murinocardiopsis flavida TaxID=645275 RepID=A0A2P8DGC1_9ACTN|nr:putative phosphothreonine lyase domain-containg protein [Murinocardiopsis flavida]PSK96246.1 uncharacterized protein DUF1917 [Murinocardiopsis flavida]